MCKYRLIVSAITVIICLCTVIYAQTEEECYQGFQFNFSPPGARAQAMGGAFIGLADDATAAYNNPAGMMILTKPEISMAASIVWYETWRAKMPDVFETLDVTDHTLDGVGGPSFASFVYPLKDICISIYFANFTMYEEDDLVYYARPIPGTNSIYKPITGQFDLVGCYFSFSIAGKLSDEIYLGTSINYTLLTLENSMVHRTVNQQDYFDVSGSPRFETYSYLQEGKIGYTLGILITPSSTFSIGAVYSYNPKYDYIQEMWQPSRNNGTHYPEADINLSFDIPDRIGAGIAFRPLDDLVIVADVVYVMYGQLTEKMIATYAHIDDPIQRGDDITGMYKAPDVTEFHFGLEYASSLGKTPLFLRAGVFSNPDHRIYYTGDNPESMERLRWNLADYSNEIKDPEIGYTLGLGTVLGEKFQADISLMWIASFQQTTLSIVYHF